MIFHKFFSDIWILGKMPPKRNNLSLRTRKAERTAAARRAESEEERTQRLEMNRQRISRSRSRHTEEEREEQNANDRSRMERNRAIRNRSAENHLQHNLNERMRNQAPATGNLNRAAFNYNNTIDYSLHESVTIGTMNKECQHCKALKFTAETPGMCCASGKAVLPELNAPPEPLLTLLSGETPESKHFLTNIRSYNACFQITSFGATNIIKDNYMPTFKIQGQIYHRVGLPDEQHKFLQIYFMGNSNDEIDQRSAINRVTKRNIIESLQALFHQHNELIRLFKTALDRMPSDDFKIVIRADKRPTGEHEKRYNAPTIDEVAIIIVGEEFDDRDIILHRRNDNIQRVSETHRSYDALQYPVIFCYGEDGYHFNIKQRNPLTGKTKD